MSRDRRILPLILIFLALPYLSLIRLLPQWRWPETDEFLWALKNSLLQAGGSAILALVAALLLLPGYLRLQPKLKVIATWLLLSPAFFPPIFLLLAFLSAIPQFPMGLAGIIWMQGFMNAGLLCVLLARAFEEKWAGLLEMSRVFGASRLLFLKANARAMLPEFLSVGLFVFAMSFASFSIPLVIGAGKATTLEILIYEKIRISADWGSALSISLIQLLMMSFFIFLPLSADRLQESRARDLRFWGSAWLIPLVVGYVIFFWAPLLTGMPGGWRALQQIPGLWDQLLKQAFLSIALALGAGVICLSLFVVSAFGGARNGVPSLMRGWIAPSTALLGFVFLFQSGSEDMSSYLLALCLIFFPAVYRLGLDRMLESLQPQVEVARTMGASSALIWRSVLIPQIWKTACVLAGIVGIWTIGEFALGKVILGRSVTWALTAESLLSSFRVEAGLGVSSLILFAGAFVFLFFWGLGHVRR